MSRSQSALPLGSMLALALSLPRLPPPEPTPDASLSQEIKIRVPGGLKTRDAFRSEERRKQRENTAVETANGASAL